MLLSASDSKVEDLAFDNLRLHTPHEFVHVRLQDIFLGDGVLDHLRSDDLHDLLHVW